MNNKSIAQILLDNIRTLKDKAPNFLSYSSRIGLDGVMFNIQYVGVSVLTLKKAGKGRQTEWCIDFIKQTLSNDKKSFGVCSWSLNNEIRCNDFVTSEKIKVGRVCSLCNYKNKIGVTDMLENKTTYYSIDEFNQLFNRESKPITETLENEYVEANRCFHRSKGKLMRKLFLNEASNLNGLLIEVRKQFNIEIF